MKKVMLCLAMALAIANGLAWAKHHKSKAIDPTLSANCGSGATIDGNEISGRIVEGTGADTSYCTMTFTTSIERSCVATVESSSAGIIVPAGVATDDGTIDGFGIPRSATANVTGVIHLDTGLFGGAVIDFICAIH
jgi:hypothetical protein